MVCDSAVSLDQLQHRAPRVSQFLLLVIGVVSLPSLCPNFDQIAGTF